MSSRHAKSRIPRSGGAGGGGGGAGGGAGRIAATATATAAARAAESAGCARDRPAPGPTRAAIERASVLPLTWLAAQPKLVLPAVTALLLAGVVFLPAVAGVGCLLVLLALLTWLSYLSWPATDGRGRAMRVISVAVLVAVGVQAVLGVLS